MVVRLWLVVLVYFDSSSINFVPPSDGKVWLWIISSGVWYPPVSQYSSNSMFIKFTNVPLFWQLYWLISSKMLGYGFSINTYIQYICIQNLYNWRLLNYTPMWGNREWESINKDVWQCYIFGSSLTSWISIKVQLQTHNFQFFLLLGRHRGCLNSNFRYGKKETPQVIAQSSCTIQKLFSHNKIPPPCACPSQKSGSLLRLLYFSNMVNCISSKLLTILQTTWHWYFLNTFRFPNCLGFSDNFWTSWKSNNKNRRFLHVHSSVTKMKDSDSRFSSTKVTRVVGRIKAIFILVGIVCPAYTNIIRIKAIFIECIFIVKLSIKTSKLFGLITAVVIPPLYLRVSGLIWTTNNSLYISRSINNQQFVCKHIYVERK